MGSAVHASANWCLIQFIWGLLYQIAASHGEGVGVK